MWEEECMDEGRTELLRGERRREDSEGRIIGGSEARREQGRGERTFLCPFIGIIQLSNISVK